MTNKTFQTNGAPARVLTFTPFPVTNLTAFAQQGNALAQNGGVLTQCTLVFTGVQKQPTVLRAFTFPTAQQALAAHRNGLAANGFLNPRNQPF